MDEEKAPQEDSQEKPRAKNEAAPARPEVSGPTKVAGWADAPTSQVVLLVFVLVYQQVESNLLQPLVYSQAVQLNGVVNPDRAAGWRPATGHSWGFAGDPGG